jgi:hypothetical protein
LIFIGKHIKSYLKIGNYFLIKKTADVSKRSTFSWNWQYHLLIIICKLTKSQRKAKTLLSSSKQKQIYSNKAPFPGTGNVIY